MEISKDIGEEVIEKLKELMVMVEGLKARIKELEAEREKWQE